MTVSKGPLALLCAVALVGCGGSSEAPAGGAAGGASGSAGGAAAASTAGPGGGQRRGGATAVLAAADLATVATGRIEASVAISGDLRALETVPIRSRLEADVEQVLVREGDRVRSGQLLARLDAGELEALRRSADADRASAQADLSTAQWNAEQSEELFKAGAIAEGDVRARRQAVDAARARLAATEARLRTAQRDLDATRVTAPAGGTIERRLVQTGERVTRGAQLFSLVRAEVLELAAAVPARAAAALRIGQTVRFTADGRAFTGRVARLSPTIDPGSRSVTVYVQVPNGDGQLRGNTFATGRVVERVVEGALLVPTAALRQSPDGSTFVYRIEGEQIGAPGVRVGVVDDAAGMAQVTDGLAAGDRVVTGNVGTLGRGMKVQIVGDAQGDARGGGAAGGAAGAMKTGGRP